MNGFAEYDHYDAPGLAELIRNRCPSILPWGARPVRITSLPGTAN